MHCSKIYLEAVVGCFRLLQRPPARAALGGDWQESLEGALGVLGEALEHISLKTSQIQLNICLGFFNELF